MNILNEYFDKIYCINLDRRPDRWEESLINFKNMNMEVERFSAFDGKSFNLGYDNTYNAEFGGTISHTKLLKRAFDLNLNNVLILEDDVEFSNSFNEKFVHITSELPEDWDILFLGGNHIGGYHKISPHLAKVHHTYALHCYAINKKAYHCIYDSMTRFIGDVLSSEKRLYPSVAADYYQAMLHKHLNVYSAIPNISWQRKSFSDIQQGFVDYSFLQA